MAIGITGSRVEAEDALNDAFCRLWSAYPDLDSETEAARLAFTTVRNEALNQRRYFLKHPTENVGNVSDNLTENGDEEERERRELYDSLLRMAARVLKDMQYKVFIMHDVENISYPEIAEKLELTQANVRQILSRARKTLRDEYRKISNNIK